MQLCFVVVAIQMYKPLSFLSRSVVRYMLVGKTH